MRHTRRAEYGWTVSGNFEFIPLRQFCHCGSADSAVFAEKSPKSISYGLWLVVFLALILPVRIKTSYSPMPVGVESFRQEKLYQAVPQVESGISLVDDFVAERTPVRKLGEEVFPMERMVEGASVVWFAGTVILLAYGMISSWKLRKKLKMGKSWNRMYIRWKDCPQRLLWECRPASIFRRI